jgi:hypothetical protein
VSRGCASRRGRSAAVLSVLAAAVIATAPAAAATSTAATAAPPGQARLSGSFGLTGTVTVARLVPGERVGQTVSRTWGFHADCPTGACATETLVRPRAGGRDTVTLRRRAPGYYVGTGSFFAPLRCGAHVWGRGALVPFTITVRITAAVVYKGALATAISATYTNTHRINRTPCFAVLGHDAAAYQGGLLPSQPTGGGGLGSVS